MAAEPGTMTMEEMSQALADVQARLLTYDQGRSSDTLRMSQLENNMATLRTTMQTTIQGNVKQMVEQMMIEFKEEKERDKKKRIKGYDSKSIDKPDKFDGRPDHFLAWHDLFVAHLVALGEEWDGLLKDAREITQGAEEMSAEDMREIVRKNGFDESQLNTLNNTLYLALLQLTSDDAHGTVASLGKDKSLEAYRSLHYKGRNETNQNVVNVKKRVM